MQPLDHLAAAGVAGTPGLKAKGQAAGARVPKAVGLLKILHISGLVVVRPERFGQIMALMQLLSFPEQGFQLLLTFVHCCASASSTSRQ